MISPRTTESGVSRERRHRATPGSGFCASREQIEALLSHATKSRLSPVQLVEHLAEIERRQREARNLASRTKKATVGTHTTMDRFEWGHLRKIDRVLCEDILGLGFVGRRENVLFRGPSGVGKTMLAQNVWLAALAAGMTVCFTNVASALADLLKQESLPAVERRMKRYTSVDLLVCDELGYVPVDTRAVDLFFQIISRRHEKASTIISTNLPFKEWGGVLLPSAATRSSGIEPLHPTVSRPPSRGFASPSTPERAVAKIGLLDRPLNRAKRVE